MKLTNLLAFKFSILLFLSQFFLKGAEVQSAEKIKIIYSIFSRTIEVNSLKEYAKTSKADKQLRRILKVTNSNDQEIIYILNRNFDIPITIASKLMYSEIGDVILTRLSQIIHTPNSKNKRTGVLALRASVIKGIEKGKGKINLINFFESYPTKTVILNVNALSKVINKVESISELLEFFTDSPLEKIKES
tara:strand:- start:1197 stop:1769 length:573 start_codon:yes stop_codon:yes gene_type:complete